MIEYQQLVEKCRRHRLNQVITNSSMSHAGVLFSNLFAAAQTIPQDEPKVMRIQSHEALESFYKDFVPAALKAMDAGVSVQVLVANRKINAEFNPFLRQIITHRNGDVRILGEDADVSINFVVVGRSAYRLENDTEAIQAIANFNDPIVSGVLTKIFDDNRKAAKPVRLTSGGRAESWSATAQ